MSTLTKRQKQILDYLLAIKKTPLNGDLAYVQEESLDFCRKRKLVGALNEVADLVEEKTIPSIPVFVDSPLAIKVTDIYKKHEDLFNDQAKADVENNNGWFSQSSEEYFRLVANACLCRHP